MVKHSTPLMEQDMLLKKGFRSILKVKRTLKEDYTSKKSFSTDLDKSQLEAYKKYFQFSFEEIPLTYLYILAQRAQLQMMVDASFPLSVLGLIHLSNEVEYLGWVKADKPLGLEAEVFIEAKEGSLLINCTVDISQEGEKKARCKSLYLSKRKSKKRKKKKTEEEGKPMSPDATSIYALDSLSGKEYAEISGDHNPIHTSNLVAKLFGFKGMIIQGWCTASKIAAELEGKAGSSIKKLVVDFKKPIVLPAQVKLNYYKKKGNVWQFDACSMDEALNHLKGEVINY